VSLVRYHQAAEDELLREIGYLELQARGKGLHFEGKESILQSEDQPVFP